MTALSIAASLLILFLLLDRIQNMMLRRKSVKDEEKKAILEVLKIVAKEELHRPGDPRSSVMWITRLLKMMGYDQIKTNLFEEDNGYDFTCLDHKRSQVYVVCKLWNVAEFDAPVSRSTVQKLIGAMVGGRVKKGLIIATGELTDEAKKYIEALPVTYRIKVIEGEKLMEQLHDLRKINLKPLIGT